MAKEKQIKVVVGPGIAAYAWVTKPDASRKNGGKSEYGDDKFKVTVVAENDAPFLDTLRAQCDEAAKLKWGKVPEDLRYPIGDGDEKADRKPEFAGKALLTAKSQYKPGCVDAKRNELPEGVWVGSGDLIKASCVLYAYEKTEKVKDGKKIIDVVSKGISLQLRNIQLLEKRAGGSGAAGDFEDEDYETPEARPSRSDDSDPGPSSTDGDGPADF